MIQSAHIPADLLSGVWLSTYTYHSSVRATDFKAEHYVRLRLHANELILEGIPNVNDSQVVANFSLHREVATGTWRDFTVQAGHKGASYRGAAQLIFDKDWKRLVGKWVGFGLRLDIKTGPWEIVYIGKTLPKKPMKRLQSI